MHCVKSSLLVLFTVSALVLPVYADLLQDVDKLTPQQAVELEKKLEQKRVEAMPHDIRITGFMQTINPIKFNNISSTIGPMFNLYGGVFDLRQPINDKFLIGGSFSGAGNYVLTESSPRVYEDMFLGCGTAQFVLDFRIFKNDIFVLSLTPGAGVILGGFNYTKTDDNARTYYTTNRWGLGFCTSLSLDATFKVHKEWGLGMGVGAFSGKVSGLRKLVSSVDASVPDIDLTGITFRISGSKYF